MISIGGIVRKVTRTPGVTEYDLENDTFRSKFSEYLPWIAYDPELKAYACADNTVGFIYECSPLAFANQNVVDTIEGLLRLSIPEGSVIQFSLIGDPYIQHYLDMYRALKTRSDELSTENAERMSSFLLGGTEGLEKMNSVPVRDFRFIVSVKIPVMDADRAVNLVDIRDSAFEILKGSRLFPVVMECNDLLFWMRRLFNDTETASLKIAPYNDSLPINRQIILSETEVHKSMTEMTIGSKHFRCITPKAVPTEIDLLQTNQLFGGIWGLQDDMNQYRTPFICTLTVIYKSLRAKLHAKCNAILQQKGFGSFARSHATRQEEHQWAASELENGRNFLQIIPMLFVYGKNEVTVAESLLRAKRLWESAGYLMQEDRGILPIMFVSALPLGFYNIKRNVENINREYVAPTDTIATLVPMQADFCGGGKPYVIFVGRKGQICGLDVFDKNAHNHNIFVSASTGSGKSFFINNFVHNYFGAGAKVRIIDIGDSYKKMATLCNGRYLDFSTPMSINPFSSIVDPEHDLPTIAEICAQMAYSSVQNAMPTEIEMQLLRNAVVWAYENEGMEAEIATVHKYLARYPQNASHDKEQTALVEELKLVAHKLAFNMKEFTDDGRYGAYFNGPSTFNIKDDQFIVLELGKLESQRALFNVAVLQVINAVTGDFYQSDRADKKLVIFDEAWQFLRDSPILQRVIEEGYRKARKHSGCFGIVTQSVNDLALFGRVGKVIDSSSAFKFYLQADDIERARSAGIIDFGEFEFSLLRSVKQNRPFYSEVFMDTPFGKGVVRLVVPPFGYYLYSSSPDDNKLIETVRAERNCSFKDAIAYITEGNASL